jgi:hypothetical protein
VEEAIHEVVLLVLNFHHALVEVAVVLRVVGVAAQHPTGEVEDTVPVDLREGVEGIAGWLGGLLGGGALVAVKIKLQMLLNHW